MRLTTSDMRLTRVDVVKALLVSPLLVPLSTPADDNIFFQSDDKSFDISLPPTWTLQAEPAPRANPQHLFYVRASRNDGAAKLEMTCDFMEGAKNLDTLGTVTKVAQKYLSAQPQPATLVSANKVPGNGMFALGTYDFRYLVGAAGGDGTGSSGYSSKVIKLALRQERLYQLSVTLPAEPTEPLRSEVDAIVDSWKAFPLNAGCLRASNKGSIFPGVCY